MIEDTPCILLLLSDKIKGTFAILLCGGESGNTLLKEPPMLYSICFVVLLFAVSAVQAEIAVKNPIADAKILINKGRHKDALELLQPFILKRDGTSSAAEAAEGILLAAECLGKLNRSEEIEKFLEDTVKTVNENNIAQDWRILKAVADIYLNVELSSDIGTILSAKKDRVRGLQLYHAASPFAHKAADGPFYLNFANALMGGWRRSWRMQILTDLTNLPNEEDNDADNGFFFGSGNSNAPVDEAGNPVIYTLPETFEKAANDGERWRWCLAQAEMFGKKKEALEKRADFYQTQFGTGTLWNFDYFRNSIQEPDKTASILSLETLTDDETIAQLATGIKRFKFPKEADFIALYKETENWAVLAGIYQDRRQYTKAAEYYNKALDTQTEENLKQTLQAAVHQITGNWGRFEPNGSKVAGLKAELRYIFRNGKRVNITVHEVNTVKLLSDIKGYLKSEPKKMNWQRLEIDRIGHHLVFDKDGKDFREKYLGKEIARWSQDLSPAEKHFDTATVIQFPHNEKQPAVCGGAYLIRTEMEDGNAESALIWLEDTAIVKKQLNNAVLYYVADAQTGQPLADAEMEFFGYSYENKWTRETNGRMRQEPTVWKFREFRLTANGDGITVLDSEKQKENFNGINWLVTASRHSSAADKEHFAFLGFNSIWFGRFGTEKYHQTKTFIITDRPVYRPKDTVQFKAWVGTAGYNEPVQPLWAGQSVGYEIYHPRGDKIAAKNGVKLDDYGGFTAELALPKDATLGNYSIQVFGAEGQFRGHQSFRVEEYRKPEYEVLVDAPKEPIKLGDKITATVRAAYYFGSPVAEAKVKYKVLREKANADWYPLSRWDWFYGNGYGWLAYDADYLPNWKSWGCCRPLPPWFPFPNTPPELVAEVEANIKPDGTADVFIDTAIAKELFPNDDQKYTITAEVIDQSRAAVVGTGTVLVSKEPFKVYAWTDKGHYTAGSQAVANFQVRRLDGKPVEGEAVVTVNKLSFSPGTNSADVESQQTEVHKTTVKLNAEGQATLSLNAAEAGQYKISCTLNGQEGGYVYNVYEPDAAGTAAKSWKFNALELLPDKAEYAPNETVKLRVNTDTEKSNILLFVKNKQNNFRLLRLDGKSSLVDVPVELSDMPNFFIEALTVSNGEVFSEVKEIAVPPQQRILNVEVKPGSGTYKPGEKAKAELTVSDGDGKPVVGQVVVSIYDKSVEYISGGSNIGDIKEFFWKWKRRYAPYRETNLGRFWHGIADPDEPSMQQLGVNGGIAMGGGFGGGIALSMPVSGVPTEMAAPMAAAAAQPARVLKRGGAIDKDAAQFDNSGAGLQANQPSVPDVVIRKNFADTALWVGALETDKNGKADIELNMPESLTAWKINVWSMSAGTRVGQGNAEVITRKNLMIRMQTPRFLVEKDKAVFSANVHNYLPQEKEVQVALEVDNHLSSPAALPRTVKISSNGEARIDWEVEAKNAGEATVVMKALTGEESDAMQKTLPVYVHGMLKQEAWSGYIAPTLAAAKVSLNVPAERKAEQTKLTVRFSPTLAGSMLEALPYLADYPYGCTEQTLNRFLPTVITRQVLISNGIEMEQLKDRLTNLNAQELGANRKPAIARRVEPVFDIDEISKMVTAGVEKLKNMQCGDGGWGWFSGWNEQSSPHLTALIVHGLHIADQNGYLNDNNVMERGIRWLQNYQSQQVQLLQTGLLPEKERKDKSYKMQADETDSFVFMVLTENRNQKTNSAKEMETFLCRDKAKISLYGAAMLGIALTETADASPQEGCEENVSEIVKIIEQYLVQDDENQTAYLNLRNDNGWRWWAWYGSEFETQAYYLKLLMRTNPKSPIAPKLVKYLLNNRRHAAYWNSTRDTAVIIEAFAEYLNATGENKPDMTVEVLCGGEVKKTVKITPENLFEIDNTLTLSGDELTAGKHEIELRKKGTGPLYYNVYLENFTLEDPILKTGLEVKIERKVYKLERDETATVQQPGSRGQVLDLNIERYKRIPIEQNYPLKSGDLVEIELLIESKNDYESILIEDLKAAGLEPVDVRSGYQRDTNGSLRPYAEFRDERVSFFVYQLPRGKHTVSYRLRAETPGSFSALPAKIEAMYAPELKANSDENKVLVEDIPR